MPDTAFACCQHCEHTEHFDDWHDTPCDHGCNDSEVAAREAEDDA